MARNAAEHPTGFEPEPPPNPFKPDNRFANLTRLFFHTRQGYWHEQIEDRTVFPRCVRALRELSDFVNPVVR